MVKPSRRMKNDTSLWTMRNQGRKKEKAMVKLTML